MVEFSKILIANRGEIACRVARSAKSLGYRTVAVFSDADAGAVHVQQADEAVRIGPPAAKESYLNIDGLLAAAKLTRADAVHPGYGFLSENAAFARACADAGLVFVGPAAGTIAAMGDKVKAKAIMAAAGVPVLPSATIAADGTGDLDAARGGAHGPPRGGLRLRRRHRLPRALRHRPPARRGADPRRRRRDRDPP